MYSEQEARELVIRAGKELLASHLIARTWGNISARISQTQCVITPSGRAYDTLRPEDLVVLNIADASAVGPGKPSSEKGVHAAAYRLRPEASVVIHTHQDYATALSALGQPLSVRNRGAETVALLGKEVPTAEYGLSSTKKLTRAVEHEIAEHPDASAVLMRNHGALCIGADFEQAFRVAHTLETVARERYLQMCGNLLSVDWTPGQDEELASHLSAFAEGEDGILRTDAPFVLRYSELGKRLIPYVDDLAMATGYSIPCLDGNADVRRALARHQAVLVKGMGAAVRAENREEAETLCVLLEKGCRIAMLGAAGYHLIPVSPLHAMIERQIYVRKYSRLK